MEILEVWFCPDFLYAQVNETVLFYKKGKIAQFLK